MGPAPDSPAAVDAGMSASFFWRPTEPQGKRLSVDLPSRFWEAMEEAFGSFPITLHRAQAPVLRGMAAASRESAFAFLAGLLEEHHESIELMRQT